MVNTMESESKFKFRAGMQGVKDAQKKRIEIESDENRRQELEGEKQEWYAKQRAVDPDGLSGFERRFCECYLYFYDPKQAYLAAGGIQQNVIDISTKMLGRAEVAKFIRRKIEDREDRMNKFGFDSHDAVFRLQLQARADLKPFIDPETGRVDMSTPRAQANLHLLKDCKHKKHPNGTEEWDIKLIDPIISAKTILSADGAFSQRERDYEREEKQMGEMKQLKWASPNAPDEPEPEPAPAPKKKRKRGRPRKNET